MKKLFALLNGARSTVELSTSDRVFEENCHRGVIHRIWHAGSLQSCLEIQLKRSKRMRRWSERLIYWIYLILTKGGALALWIHIPAARWSLHISANSFNQTQWITRAKHLRRLWGISLYPDCKCDISHLGKGITNHIIRITLLSKVQKTSTKKPENSACFVSSCPQLLQFTTFCWLPALHTPGRVSGFKSSQV